MSDANNPQHLILAVDDDPIALKSLLLLLRRAREYDVIEASSGAQGLEQLQDAERRGRLPAVVVADYLMPGMNGVQFLEHVKARWPAIQRLLLTGAADMTVLEEAINRSGIHHMVNKPWRDGDLLSSLRNACEQSALLAENARLMQEMEDKNSELTQLNGRLEELNNHLERLVEDRTSQLRYAKQAWETTFDAIRDPVILLDDNYTLLRANNALADHRQMNITELPGQRCHKVLADSDRVCAGCPLDEVRRTNQAAHSHISLAPVDTVFAVSAFPFSGVTADVVASASSQPRFVCVYRDVTAREKLQRKLIQSEKMTALGVLSGAVAHEINNPLGGILAFAQIMLREVPEHDEKHQFLRHIEDSAVRCQHTVRNLLDFARFSPREERQRSNMAHIITKAVELVRHRLNLNSIKVEVLERDHGAMHAPVVLNTNQVQMVFVNLMHNASDAMSEGGTIQIKVNLRTDTSPHQVITRVIDSGTGIDPDVLGKIFDPFFTTKSEGKGTGLGLALSRQIMDENAGKLEATSHPGKGATFTLTFPVTS